LNHLVKSEKLTGFFDAIWKAQAGGLILLTFLSFFPSWFHLAEYLFFALLLIALGTAWLDGKSIWVHTPIDLPLLLFIGWVLLTIPFATDPAYSFAEWRKLVAQVLVFYWAVLVLRAQDSKALTHGVLAAVVIGTAALCAYALTDFVARGGTWRDRYVRASAPSSDFQWLSTYMVIAIPVLVSAWVIVRTMWQRLACGGTVVLALLAQVTAYTRAGWLGLVAQGLAFGHFTGRRRLAMSVLGICVAIGLGLLALSQVGYHRDTLDPGPLHIRLAVWELGIEEVLQHPLMGIGYGNNTFVKRFEDYWETVQDPLLYKSRHGLHNIFLMVAMGSGLPALILLIWVFVKAVSELVCITKQTSDRTRYALAIGIAVMIVGFAVRNLFDYMFAGSLAYLFWILVATGISSRGNPSSV
jgi:O-antigen ligase